MDNQPIGGGRGGGGVMERANPEERWIWPRRGTSLQPAGSTGVRHGPMEQNLETCQLGDAWKQLDEKQRGPNLSELHHHVGKHVQESHHGVPEAAVR